MNAAGYRALASDDLERAIAIFRFNVTLYPDSANVYDSLGEALENAGRLEEAHASYATAATKAESNGDDRRELFAGNRDRVAGALAERAEK